MKTYGAKWPGERVQEPGEEGEKKRKIAQVIESAMTLNLTRVGTATAAAGKARIVENIRGSRNLSWP